MHLVGKQHSSALIATTFGLVLMGVFAFVALSGQPDQPDQPAHPVRLLAPAQVAAAQNSPTETPAVTQATSSTLYLPRIVKATIPDRITLQATPNTVLANGQNLAAISVQVLDEADAPVPNQFVTLTTTAGQFDTGQTSVLTRTDTSGQVTAMLRVPLTTGNTSVATVRASVNRLDGQVISNTVAIELLPVSADRVIIEALPARIPANASSTSTISLTVLDQEGNTLPDIPLELTTNRGSFANDDVALEVVTNDSGQASASLRSALGVDLASAIVTARVQASDQTIAAQTEVEFFVPSVVILSALPTTIDADVRSSLLVSLLVQDSTGAAIPDYPVSLNTNLGRFVTAETSLQLTTDANGQAAAPLYAVPRLGTGSVFVQAGRIVEETAITLEQGPCEDFEDNDVPVQGNEQPSAVCGGLFEDDIIVDPAVGEDDYYIIFLEPGQGVRVELDEIPAGADYDVILYDQNLLADPVAFSNNLNQEPEVFTYTYTGEERRLFYLRVNMLRKSESVRNDYRLLVARSPLEAPGEVVLSDLPTLAAAGEQDPPLPAKP